MLPEHPYGFPAYDGPGYVKIKLEPSEVMVIPHYSEVVLVKEIGGVTFSAMVPAHTLGENNGWVPAEYAGKVAGNVVFHLPVGNDGRHTWRVPEEAIERILIA